MVKKQNFQNGGASVHAAPTFLKIIFSLEVLLDLAFWDQLKIQKSIRL